MIVHLQCFVVNNNQASKLMQIQIRTSETKMSCNLLPVKNLIENL